MGTDRVHCSGRDGVSGVITIIELIENIGVHIDLNDGTSTSTSTTTSISTETATNTTTATI